MTRNPSAAPEDQGDPHAAVSSEDGTDAEQTDQDMGTEEPFSGEGAEAHDVAGLEVEAVAAVAAETFDSATLAPDLTGLRPIGEASYGALGVGVETVHGQDNRIQIQGTGNYPWSAHASLLITARDGSRWIGTGWFIGPHTLATAGHVVYIKNSGVPGRDGFVRSVQVMPGRNGSMLPFGSATTSRVRTVSGWASSGNPDYDYGAILLNTDLGNRTGTFGFGAYSDSTLRSSWINISGYPGDKPSGTQWYHWNRVAAVSSRRVSYDIDTAGGQSGSAVYRIVNGGRYGVAIHAYGGSVTNSGTRITRPVFDNLVAWKA
ncbi:MAG: trypsin-like peptidase domain-containing protein [Ornithinimicrobium sp.]